MPNRDAALELLALRAEAARRSAITRLLPFTMWTKPDYSAAWFHRVICETLDAFLAGEIVNLLIETPPQHGKSELVSRRLPALALGHDTRRRVGVFSYSHHRAAALNRDLQRILDDPLYRDLFPYLQFGQGSKLLQNTDFFEVSQEGQAEPGGLISTGVGGSLTGFSIDLGVIDDPVKDYQEAHSETYRDRVWEWYSAVYRTRLHNKSQTLLTMTRWHEDDLAGRILASGEGKSWHRLTLPAIAEGELDYRDPRADGEALWPERHSLENLLAAKDRNPAVFSALYQQHPSPMDGQIILPRWFGRLTEAPPYPLRRVLSVDATFKDGDSSDYVAAQVWQQQQDGTIYADELYRERAGFTRTLEIVRELAARWQPTAIIIEDKANGSAIMDVLRREFNNIIPVEPQGGKVARAFAVQPVLESGKIFLPRTAAGVESFLEECRAFPAGANDDQVDAFTQAITYLSKGASVWTANIRI